MTDAEIAAEALYYWGSAGAPLRLVWQSENVVFETRLQGGVRAALRLHRPGYQGRGGIEAELAWCAELAAAGVPVAAPIRAVDGRFTAGLPGRVVSCVAWVEGEPLGAADAGLSGSAVLAQAGAVGGLIARLHNAIDAGAAPGGRRPAWDAEGLLGETPRWGRFWEHPDLTPAEANLLLLARRRAFEALAEARDYGPIHADVIRGNVILGPAGLTLIDFDDSGPGWRLYDLASALVQSFGDPLMGAQAVALVAGYRGERPLAADQAALLPLFVALRAFASAGWVVSRTAPGDARRRAYAARAVAAGRALLEGRAPWEAS